MGRARQARRIAVTAAYGGGGLGALGAVLYGVLYSQAKQAHRTVGAPRSVPPDGDGLWGHGPGEPIRLAVLGDSGAAGLGVDQAIETPGVLVAAGLSEVAGRPVRLTNVARVGAKSDSLPDQVDRALPAGPEVALIIVGTNDVKERMRPAESVRHLVGPRHHPAGGAAAALPRQAVEPAARRRADGRGGRARRPDGLPGRHPGAGVPGPAGRDVQPGPVPSQRGGLRRGGRGDA